MIATFCVACSSSSSSKLKNVKAKKRLPKVGELPPPDIATWLDIRQTNGNLSTSQKPRLPTEWVECLQPLMSTLISPQDIDDHIQISTKCRSLLTRPTEEGRPVFLNRDWLLLNAEEYLRPSVSLQAKIQHHLGPINHSLNQGSWTLKVSLLRLPADRKLQPYNKSTLEMRGVPAPLLSWTQARVTKATLSEWGTQSLESEQLPINQEMILNHLPSPRVGQVIHLTLSKKPPIIQRGGWALHHPLWFSVPSLRQSLVLALPARLHINQFGPLPQQKSILSHEVRRRWTSHFSPAGEGDTLYLTSMVSWAKVHKWFWLKLEPSLKEYQRVVQQKLSQSGFSFFLNKRNPFEIYQWIKQHFLYMPNHSQPYEPLPVMTFLKNRRGDCKEFTMLGHALLMTQGEDSYLALTSSKPIPSIAIDIPSVGWFDHIFLWQPSPTALKLARLAINSGLKILDPGLAQYTWFDSTAPYLKSSLSTNWAYVLLNESQGIWVPINTNSKR